MALTATHHALTREKMLFIRSMFTIKKTAGTPAFLMLLR